MGVDSSNELCFGAAINLGGNAVYSYFGRYDSIVSSNFAILKITYSEGKLIWSKTIPFN